MIDYKTERIEKLKIRNELEIAYAEWKATKEEYQKAQKEYSKARMREISSNRYHAL